ncbi:hypothetical protein [Spiroplasma endosymbiont of Megaselia nigra]|uniref:hypothetical protein n=1 Tax=Spiroplasma endosymbiont of Megaselia nigra TaxID=2478537 RepID=UPI000F866AE8|nr:hypothetical protein [Spiroplasma endosymbiont of Megaselia nigra]RUO86089.1 hypothetical protein D9R21_05120 [Spiroplasma endosymbiont of Megaselia nigra]
MDDNKARIITKRASKIRFTISNALGGIGKVEIAIIVIDFLITALIFSFLFKYQIIASVLITIFMWLTSLILMFPTKNGTKLYNVVWTAFEYIFVKKQNNDVLKISQIQKIENNTIKFKHKTSIVYRIEAVDISLDNQQERDTPIYKLASIFKTIDIDFEICKIQTPYEFNEQIKNIDNLLVKEKTEFKKTQLTNLKNWYLNLQYSNQKLKTAYFLMITADNITLINQKLRYVINEFDNNIKFIKATFKETSLLVQRNIIPTNNVFDKPHKIRQFANYVTVDSKFVSYLTVSLGATKYLDKFYLQKKDLPKTPNEWVVVDTSDFVQGSKGYKIKNFNKSEYYYRLWCYTSYEVELFIITHINFTGQLASGVSYGNNPSSWITVQLFPEGEFKLSSTSNSVKIKELYIERKIKN